MGLFSKKKYIDSYSNIYYKGNDCFSFFFDDNMKASLIVIRDVSNDSSNLYKCCIHYSSDEIYNNIIAGIDLDEMRHSSKYTKFVFENIFSKENVKNVDKSSYVGSAFVLNGSFSFVRDENMYKKYYTLSYLRYLALKADLHNVQEQLKSNNSYVKKIKR